ncbi:nitroreductase [Aneurinibacillus sp. Ricciae_BoGa-3]|uniref:nitroreductase family protein n=1 Tax=Aneurinibacillus sp. Ricciae_BoGa-3 TaxID=3022697 RepID=UPI0023407A29|nr:nitroreductase [Aneurinibacillus sp. Ricciae_BoGa-3]WCK55746.1 nitroreductase [Aneurinibacillus sp. Ricciae_BoGa-3]
MRVFNKKTVEDFKKRQENTVEENLLAVIKSRQSIGKVTEQEVPREILVQIIEAGTRAPSHYNTQPWKFFVMTGNGRDQLGQAYGEIEVLNKGKDAAEEDKKQMYQNKYKKAFRAPAVIAVACSPVDNGLAVEPEEKAAVAACIQNMLLAIHALGYAAIWRTGEACYHPLMRQKFGLGEHETMMGLIYIGRPASVVPQRPRVSVEEKVTWLS